MQKVWNYKKVFIFSVAVSAGLCALIFLLGGRLAGIPHLPDEGAHWYFWKHAQPSAAGRISVWTGYILHQLFVWAVIFRARKADSVKVDSNGGNAGIYNIVLLIGNVFFILLHLLQTHLWYDGLARDVPIWTSQGSVIVMLILTLVMLSPRRGFILGRRIGLPPKAVKVLHLIHGPYIAWALVYTFWFHPMEGSYGLLTGFFYMFLLFIQMSMFGTRLHTDLRWLVLLETMVAVHGTLITVQKDNPIWPMFLSGFLFMFAFTYAFGLTKKRFLNLIIIALFFSSVMLMYSQRGFEKLYELSFIPTALYGGGIVLIFFLKAIFRKTEKRN